MIAFETKQQGQLNQLEPRLIRHYFESPLPHPLGQLLIGKKKKKMIAFGTTP